MLDTLKLTKRLEDAGFERRAMPLEALKLRGIEGVAVRFLPLGATLAGAICVV